MMDGQVEKGKGTEFIPAVQAALALTVDVADVVLLGDGSRLLLHLAVLLCRPLVLGLHKLAVQALHEAVRVAVAVNGRSLGLGPAEQDQVVLAVALVDQVARVP